LDDLYFLKWIEHCLVAFGFDICCSYLLSNKNSID